MYLPTFQAIADKESDFVHLWLGGKMFYEGHGTRLYNSELQKLVLTEELGRDPKEAELWAQRNDLFGAFWYPPITALLYAPFGTLTLHDAKIVMGALTIILALVASIFFSKFLNERLSASLIATLILLYPPFTNNFALGQNGMITLSLLVIGAYLLQQKRYFTAGLVWGCLIYKPTWFLSMIWVPIALGTLSTLWGMLVVCLIGGVASLVYFETQILEYVELFFALRHLPKLPDYPLTLQYSLPSFFAKFLGTGDLSVYLGWASIALILAATIVTMRRGMAMTPVTLVLCLATAALINPHMHHYDIIMGIVGILFLVKVAFDSRSRLRVRLLLVACAAYSALLIENRFPSLLGNSLPTLALILVWVTLLFLSARKGMP